MIRHRFDAADVAHIGIRKRRLHHRRIVIDGLLEKIRTNDSNVADLAAVHQLRVADDVAPVAGTVAAQVAKEEFVGSASGASGRPRRMVSDALRQLEELQAG